MQAKLADMYTSMNVCRGYLYNVLRACDRGIIRRNVSFFILNTRVNFLDKRT